MWKTLGFEKNKKYFEQALAENSLSHAYLFSGQEMIGKKTFALELARKVNNFPGEQSNDPDLLMMNSESGLGIEEVRKVKNFLSLRPYAGRFRVVLIDEAERLGVEAGNALLKVLEEPPVSALILLVTSSARAVLATIFSRAMEIKFSPHSREQLISYLAKMDLNSKQAEFLADFANGRLGLAYRLQQANSFKDIRKNLEQFNALVEGNYYTRLAFAEKVFAPKTEAKPRALLLNWMFYLRSDFSKSLKINRSALLRKMLEIDNILVKPQYNHRLAFENLMLSL
ncbi:MAG: hypothetical protein Q7S32_03175 [bacterium]|nr:hypothetical protein [bacterium]